MCEKSETIIKSDYFCTFSLHYKSLITKKKAAPEPPLSRGDGGVSRPRTAT